MSTAADTTATQMPYLGEHQTVAEAARMMRDLGAGALPICGDDDRLLGVVTERDIVWGCVAEGSDPTTSTVGELVRRSPHVVPGIMDTAEVVRVMKAFRPDRAPVPGDDARTLIGMITETDVARHMSPERLSERIKAIAEP